MTIKNHSLSKKIKHTGVRKKTCSKAYSAKKNAPMRLPDLTEFRKTIRVKGKPLSQIVNEGRG